MALLLAVLLTFLLASPAAAEEGIPEACRSTGITLQSACSTELNKATAFFGVSSDASGVQAAVKSGKKLDSYLADPANKPTPRCCAASKSFNAARCNCNRQVQALAKSFVGGDMTVYNKFTSAVAKACGFSKIC